MSHSVQSIPVANIANRLELAQRISGAARAPEQTLKALFTGIMQGFEEMANIKFRPILQERVWQSVPAQKLKTLKETLILEFCNKILNGFKDDEINQMLAEHKKTGSIKNPTYSAYIRTSHALNYNDVVEAVIQKAEAMKKEWMSEIIAAIKKEGVQLPIEMKPICESKT